VNQGGRPLPTLRRWAGHHGHRIGPEVMERAPSRRSDRGRRARQQEWLSGPFERAVNEHRSQALATPTLAADGFERSL